MGQLEDIQIFIRIVEAGGIGKAAEQLNLAKSAVSRRLADLEQRLGTKLIQRTTRTSSLTEAGKSYYQRALKVTEAVEEMNSTTAAEDAQLEGTLRLAVPLSFGLDHLTPALDLFAKEHPQLTLQIDFSDREVDMVEEGFDLAFRITDLKDSTIQARKIVPIKFAILASPDYLQKYGEPKTHHDLKDHKVLKYSFSQSTEWGLVDKDGQMHHINFTSHIHANNGSFLVYMATKGHGIVLSPTFICWEAVATGDLVPVLTDYHIPSIHAYAIYPQNRYLSQKARVFIDFLVERFGENAYWDQV